MDEAPVEPPQAPRGPISWAQALGRGLGILYLPQLTAVVIGPLGECDHCVETFFELFLILPGLLGATLLHAPDKPIVASLVTVTLAFGVIQIMRQSGKAARIGGIAIALLSALNALAISHMLRA